MFVFFLGLIFADLPMGLGKFTGDDHAPTQLKLETLFGAMMLLTKILILSLLCSVLTLSYISFIKFFESLALLVLRLWSSINSGNLTRLLLVVLSPRVSLLSLVLKT